MIPHPTTESVGWGGGGSGANALIRACPLDVDGTRYQERTHDTLLYPNVHLLSRTSLRPKEFTIFPYIHTPFCFFFVCFCPLLSMTLRDRTILITRGNAGLGRATAAALASQGATVVLACRSPTRAAEAAASLNRDLPGGDHPGRVEVAPPLDLADPSSIRAFAKAWGRRRLDCLINNAGMGPLPESVTDQGVPLQAQINSLGPIHLTRLLETNLQRGAKHLGHPARVVHVSSVTSRVAFLAPGTNGLTSFFRDPKTSPVCTHEIGECALRTRSAPSLRGRWGPHPALRRRPGGGAE